MIIYTIHIYREMRLQFGGIEADSPEAAAAVARDRATEDADAIEDCDGETIAALVDVEGNEDHVHPRTIDFEGGRTRRNAAELLAALEGVLPYAENEAGSLFECWRRDDDAEIRQEADACDAAISRAHAAIAVSKAAGFPPADGPAEPPVVAVPSGLVEDADATGANPAV